MFNYNDVDFDDNDTIDHSPFGLDLDGDGKIDEVAADLDNDGQNDTFYADTNGDGEIDAIACDVDGNGNIDYVALDTDNNGTFESFAADSNGDGNLDVVAIDSNDDGVIDFAGVDSNGDGNIDVVTTDIANDHYFTYYTDDSNINHGLYTNTYFDYPRERCYITDLEQFNPYQYSSTDLHGNPESSMQYWEYQSDTNRCALYSQKFIIEELTGQDIDIDQLARISEENNWFDETFGTSVYNINRVLDYYGINNEMTFGNSIDDIKESLDTGKKVIVSIDADEIWYGELDNIYTPGDGVNHAVEVIGIIDNAGMEDKIVLNDSGNPNGKGVVVPMDAFIDAWQDGNNQMVTCIC